MNKRISNKEQLDKEQEILKNLKRELHQTALLDKKIDIASALNVSQSLLSEYGINKLPSVVTFALLCQKLQLDSNDILGIVFTTDFKESNSKTEK